VLETALLRAAKEAIARATVGLPSDIVAALERAVESERSEMARYHLKAALENVRLAVRRRAAACQDTGFPSFYVKLGDGFPLRSRALEILAQAVREVSHELPLRPNVVHPITGRVFEDNVSAGAPWFDVELAAGDYIEFFYVPRGGGSELPSVAFTLPPGIALRELPRAVLRAVVRAGPVPCPPVIVGIGVGPSVDIAARLAKRAAVLRPAGSRHPEPEIARVEEELLRAINMLGIGAQGVGGAITALDVHVEYACRHPAAFSVGIAFSCWATRRAGARVYPDGSYEPLDAPPRLK
jgi:fumarate hydratase subunit alpha